MRNAHLSGLFRCFSPFLCFSISVNACAAIREESLTFLGLQIGGGDTLAHAAQKLGKATEWRTGDTSTSETKVCYRVQSAGVDVVIVFASGNEMSSPKGQINNVRVYQSSLQYSQRALCAHLSLTPVSLSTQDGLRVGLSEAEVRQKLGNKPLATKKFILYRSHQKRYFRKSTKQYDTWIHRPECFEEPDKPYFHDFSSIEFRFSLGTVHYMEINRNQSVC